MKILKKLAILVMALTLCVGFGGTMTACDKEGSSNSQTQKGYTFKVVNKDDTPAVGYYVQLCKTNGTCLEFVAVDEDGVILYALDDTSIDYEVHVLDANQDQVEFTGLKTVTANHTGEIQLKLK